MTKMVIVVNDAEQDVAAVARDVAEIPGVSVTSRSDAYIDVDAREKGSVALLREFTRHTSGLSLHRVAEPELMEPIAASSFL